MLTGQRPFDGDTPASTLSAIIRVAPQSVTELRPSVPRDLAKFLRRCLSKDPDRRYQTCKDVRNELEELKEALSTGELEATAPARARTSRSWIVAGAALLLVAGVFLWSRSRSSSGNVPRLANPVQVTSAIGVENHPTWSPERGRIAYESNQRSSLDIWISQVGGAAVNFTEDFEGLDYGPRWSPDGSQILFKSAREDGGCFLIPSLGGTPRRVVASTSVFFPGENPVWSPDGALLGCPGIDDQSRPFVDVLTVATQTVERLALPGQYAAADLNWSPDGRFLAFAEAISPSAETTKLWVVSLSGEATVLSDGTTEVWSPMWSPDGTSLLYISSRGGSKDLWIQNLDSDAQPQGDPKAVTTGLGIQSAALTADGTRIAYSNGGRLANVWRIPILADRVATWSDAEQLTFDQAFVEFLGLSPDGSRLVINSNRSGFQDLWILPAEGGEMKNLTNDSAPDWMPAWSPDGSEIAFYTGRSGNRDIFVIPSGGGPLRQLTTQTGGDIMPAWSPDGEQISYVSIRDGNYDIWVMSKTGDEKVRLTDHGGEDNLPDWSPDGQWIAYSSQGAVWRVPAAGGEPERLTQDVRRLARWSPDGENLYYGGRRELVGFWTVSLRDRSERRVADLSGKPGLVGGFALATDGNYLYFTWEETLGDIWVMDVIWDE